MTDEAQNMFEMGKKLLEQKNFTEALKAFANAKELEPSSPRYHTWYSYALIINKQFNEAIIEANTAIQIDQNYEDAFIQLADGYEKLKEFQKAIECYSQVIRINPLNCSAYENRGHIYQHQQDFDLAEKDFTRAIKIDPLNPSYYQSRSRIYYEIQNWENYYLDRIKYQEFTGIGKYSDDNEGENSIKIIDNHFHQSVYPHIKSAGEKIIDYWPNIFLVWDRIEKQRLVNGGSFDIQYGTIGQGYICLTDKSLRIFSLAVLSSKIKPPRSFFSFLSTEKFEVSKKDYSWTIPNQDIQGSQVYEDRYLKVEFVVIKTSSGIWSLNPYSEIHEVLIPIALNMARMGKFTDSEILKEQLNIESSEKNIFLTIKELSELHEKGIITDTEFEEKKKDLLNRI